MTDDDDLRFWLKVKVAKRGCWRWLANRNKATGYGQFKLDGRTVSAHVVMFRSCFGEVPQGLVVDHMCENRGCVNPSHLRAITQSQNVKRSKSLGIGAAQAASARKKREQAYCHAGHSLDRTNKDGSRRCRTCNRDRMRLRRKNLSQGLDGQK